MAVAEGRVCLNDANRIPVFTALVLEREGSAAQEKSGMSFLQLCCRCHFAFHISVALLLIMAFTPTAIARCITSLRAAWAVCSQYACCWTKSARIRSSVAIQLEGGGRSFSGDRSAGSATCDVNAFSSNKYTALHIATRHRYMEIVKVLLQVPSASSSHSSLPNFKASVLILQFSRTGPTATL